MIPRGSSISVLAQWRATVANELRQLMRDRTGLILLFLMPAILVLVITMVQDPLLRQEGGGFQINGLLIDQDGGRAARSILEILSQTDSLAIVETIDGTPVDLESARRAVTRGAYQFYLVVPPDLSAALDRRMAREIEDLLAGNAPESASLPTIPGLTVCFDPALRSSYRSAISGAVHRAAATMETAFSFRHLNEALNRRLASMRARGGAAAAGDAIPHLQIEGLLAQRVSIEQITPGPDPFAALPTAVQQNVPAWALFGMFFIVVPLSTSIIRERRDGIIDRLRTMPVSLVVILLGKLSAYTCVCMVQFLCIVMVGKWILPLMGTDALVLGDKLAAVVLIALCSSLAATGYGILLGAVARTQEQATVVGPVTVVIAAVLGGIMVPVFAMPHLVQTLSQGSPLAWGHSAFMTVLVRGGGWAAISGRIGLLLLFFILSLLIGGLAISRRR